MHIQKLCEHITHATVPNYRLWCMLTKPLHGISQHIIHHVSAFDASRHMTLDLQEMDLQEIERYVTTPFLGQKWLYILRGLHACDKQMQRRVLQSLSQQVLAHHVVVYTDQEDMAQEALRDSSTGICVKCQHVSRDAFMRIYAAVFGQSFPQGYARAIYTRYRYLHIADAYLTMWYYYVLGKRFTQWCETWLPKVVEHAPSLFALSTYFFKKNSTKLWLTWRHIASDYPIEFWIAFWAEHIWQAYVFISVAQEHTVARARKTVTKLPYSFIQEDWRHIQRCELAAALTHVYTLDLHLKHGGTPDMIELLFHRWMSGTCASTLPWEKSDGQ